MCLNAITDQPSFSLGLWRYILREVLYQTYSPDRLPTPPPPREEGWWFGVHAKAMVMFSAVTYTCCVGTEPMVLPGVSIHNQVAVPFLSVVYMV